MVTQDDTRFADLIESIEGLYDWSYVEMEGINRVRFDWAGGNESFWVNDDLTIEGNPPQRIRKDLRDKGLNLRFIWNG